MSSVTVRERDPQTAASTGLPVEELNASVHLDRRAVRRRARRRLRTAECGILTRWEHTLQGNVLQLDPDGGPLTAALHAMATSLTVVSPSVELLENCQDACPTVRCLRGGAEALMALPAESFDAVVIAQRSLDLVSHETRQRLLRAAHRLLAHDGLLIFSSHNLACESLVPKPGQHVVSDPLRLPKRVIKLRRAQRNRARLTGLQQREHGYAVLNNPTAEFGLLNYYISRDAQERQLTDIGFRMVECVTLGDERVPPGQHAYGCHELYYVAEPAPDPVQRPESGAERAVDSF